MRQLKLPRHVRLPKDSPLAKANPAFRGWLRMPENPVLLGTNRKLDKRLDDAQPERACGLNMLPDTLSGEDFCRMSGICRYLCLGTHSGMMQTSSTRFAQAWKSALFIAYREAFLQLLRRELDRLVRIVERTGVRQWVRLNIATDIDWESIVQAYPSLDFNGYTKVPGRLMKAKRQPNWYVAFSRSERDHDVRIANMLRTGQDVSVVFDARTPEALPKSWTFDGQRFRCENASKYDRWMVPAGRRTVGRIGALHFLGGRKKLAEYVEAGFVLAC